MDPDYVESVWWSLKEIFDKGLLVQDHRVAPWCPRCGTGLSDHELAQGYETVVDPSVYVRFPLTSGPLAGRGVAAGLDDHPVDAGLQHRRRRPPRRHLRRRHRRQREAGRRRAAAGEGARRGLDGHRRSRFTGARDGALDLRAPVRPRRDRRAPTSSSTPTTSPPRTAPAWSTRPRAFGEDDLRTCRAYGLPVVNPVRPDGTFEEELALVGGQFFKKADEALVADLDARGLLFRHLAVRAQLPALLALPHRAALLRPAVLVHPHHRDQGRPAAGERDDQLVPGLGQARPLRRLAQQQHRLGAVPQPLLGHPAAHLALRGGPPHLRRLARRADRADRHRPVRPRPAPPVHRRGHLRLPADGCRATADARARGHRRLVRLGLDAVRAVGLPVPQQGAVREALPGAVHLRGHRPDPRLVLHADGGRHARLRQVLVRERGLPRPHPRRGRPEDVQAPGQHPRADPADGPARRRRGALVHGRRRLAVGGPPGGPRHHPGGRPQDAADVLEHGRLPGPVRPHVRLGALRGRPGPGRAPAAGPLAAGRAERPGRAGHRGAGGATTPSAPASCCPPSSTTCPTGTSAAPAAASGRATRPRCARCTRSSRRSPG